LLFQCAEEAGRLYVRSFEGRRDKLGPDHPSTQFSLYLQNRFQQKREKWEQESEETGKYF